MCYFTKEYLYLKTCTYFAGLETKVNIFIHGEITHWAGIVKMIETIGKWCHQELIVIIIRVNLLESFAFLAVNCYDTHHKTSTCCAFLYFIVNFWNKSVFWLGVLSCQLDIPSLLALHPYLAPAVSLNQCKRPWIQFKACGQPMLPYLFMLPYIWLFVCPLRDLFVQLSCAEPNSSFLIISNCKL